jgi:hypothetical protein
MIVHMGFIVFEKGSAPVKTVPTVTIQRKGLMSMNRAAHALFGSPAAVELLWDPERRVIGLRPAPLESPNAYPVRPQNDSGRGPLLIATNMFTKFIELDTTEAKRWVPTVDDGVLLIDLSTPGARAISNRHRSEGVADGVSE